MMFPASSPKRNLAIAVTLIMLVTAASAFLIAPQNAEGKSRALPSRVNLSSQVPYHPRAGDDLTGEAGLSMIFDYHGPYIMQQDIRNISKGILGSGQADPDELIMAAHYSGNYPISQKGYRERILGYGGFSYDWRDDDDRSEMKFADLYKALSEGHPVLCYMFLDIPPELNPNPQPPDPNNPQPPDPQVTPDDLASLETVWRLVVGYDSTQGNGMLFVHDPVPSGIGYKGGRSVQIPKDDFNKMWNVYIRDGVNIDTHRYGVSAAPWKLDDLQYPDEVDAGTQFEVSANISYWAPSVMAGASVRNPVSTLSIPEDYSMVSSVSRMPLEISGPRTFQEVSWTVRSPDREVPGQDTGFTLNATGNITVSSPAHFDRIGTTSSFEVRTLGFLNHPPVIKDSLIDPEMIPDDGSVQPVIAAVAEDEDGNLRTVEIDLSPIGSSSTQRMYDDGTNGDDISGDGIYSYQIKGKISVGEYIIKITAKDSKGGRGYDNVTLTVLDSAELTKAPDIVDKGVHPMGIPNDGSTTSIIWAIVEDPEDDLDDVFVDLTSVGGDPEVRMYDDGTSGDLFEDDGNYSVEFTVDPTIAISIYQVEITATDDAGHETTAKTWVDVILPPVGPTILGASPSPEEVDNDGTSPVVLTVNVEDPNKDVEKVWVDLTPINGPEFLYMKDDGIAPDTREDDGTWTVEFTVGSSVSEGLKGQINIIAEDENGLRGTGSFSLRVNKANTPPEIVTYNITDSNGQATTEFSEGDIVALSVVALDEDLEDLTVRVDLSEFGMSSRTLPFDDGDTYSGEFTIPANLTPRIYNVTVTVSDMAGSTDSVRIRLTIISTSSEESDELIDPQIVLIISIVGFGLLFILVVAIVMKSRSSPRKPPVRAPPGAYPGRPMPAPGQQFGARPGTLR
jgi:hypothetical protein